MKRGMEQATLYRSVCLIYAICIISVVTAWDREADEFLEQADVRQPLTDGAARHCKGSLCARSTGLTDNTFPGAVGKKTAQKESVTAEDSTSTNDRVLSFIRNLTIASAATVLSAVTILGNLAVIVTLALEPRLRHSYNLLIMSLSISDLWVGLVSIPLYGYYLLQGVWDLGQDFCMIWLVLDWVMCAAALHCVFFITMDRYMSVLYAVWYRNWKSDSKMFWMIGTAWMVPTIFYPPLILFYIPENYVPMENQCEVPFTYDVWFSFFVSVCQFWIFACAMIYFYVEIYKVAKELGRRVVGSNQSAKYVPEVTSKSRNFSQNWHYVPVLEEKRDTILENDFFSALEISHLEGNFAAWNETRNVDPADQCKDRLNGTIFLTTSSVKSAIGTPAECLRDTTTEILGETTTTHMTNRNTSRATETPIHTGHSRNNSATNIESVGHHLTIETTATTSVDPANKPNKPRHVSIALESHLKTHQDSTRPEEIGTGVDLPSIEHDAPPGPVEVTASDSLSRGVTSMLLARDHRALKAISLYLITFLVCCAPYHLTMITPAFCSNCLNSFMFHIAYIMWYLNSAINPFLYACANGKLRASIMRTLRLRPRARP